MALPPNRTELADTQPNPSNGTFKAGIGKLYDYVTGLLGATGNASEARTALGAGTAGSAVFTAETQADVRSAANVPSRTGGDASGTWPISVTGNAATATQLSTASGSAPSYAVRAAVNFNGTGTVAMNTAKNVSSITDNGVGSYTLNFATAMPAANYVVVGSARGQNDTDTNSTIFGHGGIGSAASVAVFTKNAANALVDTGVVSVMVLI